MRLQLKLGGFSLAALLLCAAVGSAPDEDHLSLAFRYFSDSNRQKVLSQKTRVRHSVGDSTALKLMLGLDLVDLPPADTVSSASRPMPSSLTEEGPKKRFEVTTGLDLDITEEQRVSPFYYHSREKEYLSTSAGLDHRVDLFQKNLTITGGYFYTLDTMFIEDSESVLEGHSGKLGFSRIMTRTWLVDLSWQGQFFSGNFSDNRVFQTSTGEREESLPGGRESHSLGLTNLVSLTPGSSIQFVSAGHKDDWGLLAWSMEAKLYYYLFRSLLFRVNYRYLDQEGAQFFDSAAGDLQNYTANPAYAPMNSRLWGLGFTWIFRGGKKADLLSGSQVQVLYENYEQSSGLQAHIVQMSMRYAL